MIHIQGYDGGAPTRRLTDAIRRLDPALLDSYDRNRADLTIVPACQEDTTRERWYDLHWSHPGVEPVEDWSTGEQYPTVTQVLMPGQIGTIGAPPSIPVEERLAAAEPVSLDGVSDAHLAMYGGPDGVREILETRRDIAIRHDRTVDAYDWDALAATVVELVRALDPPKLTAGQRAHVAAARLLDAIRRVPAERASLAEHLRNAEQAGDHGAVQQLRTLLDVIDPAVVVEKRRGGIRVTVATEV
jgi:hypothetical protein